jgi:CBS domain-containing protein
LYATPDEFVSDALSRMATRGLRHLPVCEASQPNKILGLLDRDRVLDSISIAQTEEALKPYLEISCSQDDSLTDGRIDTMPDTTTIYRVPSISP